MKNFAGMVGPFVKVVDRDVPTSIFKPLLELPERTTSEKREKALAKALHTDILAKLRNFKSPTHNYSYGWDVRGTASNADLKHTTEVPNLIAALKKIQASIGPNHDGQPACTYTMHAKENRYKPPAAAAVLAMAGLVGHNIYNRGGTYEEIGTICNVDFKRFYPPDRESMPPEPQCYGPRTGRMTCPRCTWSNPKDDKSNFCKTCQLYMTTSATQGVNSAQQVKQADWKKIGRDIAFNFVATPKFISRRGSVVSPKIRDPYEPEMEADQLKCYMKAEIGPHPDVHHLKVLIHDGYSAHYEVRLASVVKPPVGSTSLEQKYFSHFLTSAENVNAVKGPLVITAESEEVVPERDEKKLTEKEKAAQVRIVFRLFVDPTKADKKYDYGTPPGFWGSDRIIMTLFLTPDSLPELAADIPEATVKEEVAEGGLLKASKPNNGGFADLSIGVPGLLLGIISESLRLGVRPQGFAVEDPRSYTRELLPQAVLDMLGPQNAAAKKREKEEKAIKSSRYHAVQNTLADILSDLENCGHPEVDAEDASLKGLNVELRPYQRQSLQWALDQEQRNGGMCAHLYAELTTNDDKGTGLYYSPFFGEIEHTKPHDVRGGFICEEMGMGKTVITLGLVLCNPAPKSTNGAEAEKLWGQYAPDELGRMNKKADAEKKIEVERENLERELVSLENELTKQRNFPPNKVIDTAPGGVVDPVLVRQAEQQKYATDRRDEHVKQMIIHYRSQVESIKLRIARGEKELKNISLQRPQVRSRATLVVCPVSLVGQWCSEARSKLAIAGSVFKIHEYHGTNRIRDATKLAAFDLVVTTYETLSTEFHQWQKYKDDPAAYLKGGDKSKRAKSAPKQPTATCINWWRVVLDESHKVKHTSWKKLERYPHHVFLPLPNTNPEKHKH